MMQIILKFKYKYTYIYIYKYTYIYIHIYMYYIDYSVLLYMLEYILHVHVEVKMNRLVTTNRR